MEFHPVASIFPLMEPMHIRLVGTSISPPVTVRIEPSPTHDKGHSFIWLSITLADKGFEEYFPRPVRADFVLKVLETLNIPPLKWESFDADPLSSCPFVTKSHPKPCRQIYFVRSIEDTGPIKIGSSDDPEYRLELIQPNSPVQLKIIATMDGGSAKEKELHKRFAKHRLHGEWFEQCDELIQLIESLDINGATTE